MKKKRKKKTYRTPHEIAVKGFEALVEKLGPAGLCNSSISTKQATAITPASANRFFGVSPCAS